MWVFISIIIIGFITVFIFATLNKKIKDSNKKIPKPDDVDYSKMKHVSDFDDLHEDEDKWDSYIKDRNEKNCH